MAEVILYGSATGILEKLVSVAFDASSREFNLICGFKGDLKTLSSILSTVQAVLLDAEEQQRKSHQVRDWLGKLKDVVDDADDLLDDLTTEAELQALKGPVSAFFSSPKWLYYRIKTVHRLEAILKRLSAVAAERAFHLNQRSEERHMIDMGRRNTHSFVRPEDVIGRDKDKEFIVGLLLDSTSPVNVSVIPIIGIGGLGKTTLAQLVYNEERVKKHFELTLWVCVSDVFDVKLIVENILEKPSTLTMEGLQKRLRQKVDGKKYLLVMDDVWNEDRGSWLELEKLLRGGAKGSKIIVTTRSKTVANVMRTVDPWELRGLSEEESWHLFKQFAFSDSNEPINPEHEAVGKEILMKCGGVPLAIRTLGSMLYGKSIRDWESVNNNELWEKGILAILKLSYDHLPSCLKQCFAYCSLFPKDYVFSKQTLIRLWMAQGFVQSTNSSQTPEDVGEQYFMNLLDKSFLQDAETDEWGNISSCKMHDLMYDLAKLVAGYECSMVDQRDAGEDIQNRTRHISLNCRSTDLPSSWFNQNKLRTFLLLVGENFGGEDEAYKALISRSGSLRVLLMANSLKRVPSCIGKLKHLRYLDLSYNTEVKVLPESLTELQNLQTLDITGCRRLRELPEGIRNLKKLRHLENSMCHALILPRGLGQLTFLQTLKQFVVGKDKHARLSELHGLNNLRGELLISFEGKLRNAGSEDIKANLKQKQHLQSLIFDWSGYLAKDNLYEDEEFFWEELRPHGNIKSLRIEFYLGKSLPGCMARLPYLRVLRLEGLRSVEYIEESRASTKSSEEAFFLQLEELKLSSMPKLKGWWREEVSPDSNSIPLFPRLSKLRLDDCPNLSSMPLYPFVERLEMIGVSLKTIEQASACFASPYPSFPSSSTSPSLPIPKLKFLRIQGVDEMVSLPEWILNLTSLECLKISYCRNLEYVIEEEDERGLGFRGLSNSLCTLVIEFCPNLKSVMVSRPSSCGGGKLTLDLTALQELKILDCEELDLIKDDNFINNAKIQCLKSLRTLRIVGIENRVSLPEWLQHLTSLRSLYVVRCKNLRSIPDWIVKLSSLQHLSVESCPEIRRLPEGMRCFTSLQTLTIWDCHPQLKERCKEGTGEDWPYIAHVPHLSIC